MAKPVLNNEFIYNLLERKYRQYNTPVFLDTDPVSIPHLFTKKQDIEIAGFFAAVLAWGQRKTIIANATRLMQWMDNSPHQFITQHNDTDLKPFLAFKHRTFNATDTLYFIEFLKHFYKQHNTLEKAFSQHLSKNDITVERGLAGFHHLFFSLEDAPHRTRKHLPTPERKSTCKRINMYLRWMVRQDKNGVDFGIWKDIKPARLLCPLDVHVDRIARKLGLIKRKQTNWETVLELTANLRSFDPADPVKYDFALFGLSVLDKGELNKIQLA